MVRCFYCSNDELLPFTCSYCGGKFCRRHHLPEKHDCTGMTSEKIQAKRQAVKKSAEQQARSRGKRYKPVYKIPGVTEVLERGRRAVKGAPGKSSRSFDVDDKAIATGILLLILLLGVLSRAL